MKKIIGPGLLAGVVMLVASLIVSLILNKLFPSLAAQYANTALYRPWNEPLMQLFFLAPFLTGLFLAYVWLKAKSLFPANRNYATWYLGVLYTLSCLPGLLISYSTFPISLLMVMSWVILIFVQGMLGAMILVKMIK